MTRAAEYQQVWDGLWFWQAYDPSVKTELSCCAVALRAGLVFIDPIPMVDEALAELTERASPAAVILTSANHTRAADFFREKFTIPVFAHLEAKQELTIKVDHFVEEGATILDDLTPIHLPGFAPGEMAIHHPALGAMFVGDALINVGSDGFSPLPAKYCADAKLGLRSLRKLLNFDFELMTFAHGLPIISGARRRLANLVA